MKLDNPVLVGITGDLRLIASGDVLANPNTDAQTWSERDGYSEVQPLQVWLKFLYYIEAVNPPEPWTEPL